MKHLAKKTRKILEGGGLVVMPSDTIYGIFALASDPKAVEKLYEVRGRNSKKPCIVLIAVPEEIFDFGVDVTAEDFVRIKKLWRSATPTSIVLPLAKSTQSKRRYLHRGHKTLAFRVPSQRNARGRMLKKLLAKTGPLLAPSANPEGRQPAATTREAQKYFGDTVDCYVSAGRRLEGTSSRIITGENQSEKIR